MYGIDHEVTALFFDRAVSLFGRSVENDLDDVTAGAKTDKAAHGARMRVLARWLSEPGKSLPGAYRDPGVSRG